MRRISRFLIVLLIGFGILVFGAWRIATLLVYRPHAPAGPETCNPPWIPLQVTNPRHERIAAWFYPGKPGGPAMLLCHGHAADHRQVAGLAETFCRAGFSVILPDLRAHGQSEGEFTPIGLHEWEDIAAVFAELDRRGLIGSSTPIGAYGCSMGAATLAHGIAHLPRIRALVLESCFAELRTVARRDLETITGLEDSILLDLLFKIAIWRSGYAYDENQPIQSLAKVASTPMFLIQDEADIMVRSEEFERLRKAIPTARTWTIPNACHINGFGTAGEEFPRRILDFLAENGVKPSEK